MFRFGLIGCGTISKTHAAAIAAIEGAKLVACYDILQERSATFAQKWGAEVSDSFEAMLASDIDAVCVCLPSGLHVPYTIMAARAGKHVVCEKPVGITQAQLDELKKAAAETGVRIGAISQLYFTDGFQAAKRAVDAGALGRLYLADVSMKYFRTAEYFKNAGWRGTWAMDGGGALMNQCIHGVQLMLHLMGPARSVRAYTRTLAHDIEVEDTAVAAIEFESGALGSLIGATSTAPGFDRRISVYGEKGSFQLCEEIVTDWRVPEPFSRPGTDGDPTRTASDPARLSYENHRRQIAEFIDAVRAGRDPILGIREGSAAVELILAVYRASQTGETVFLNRQEGGASHG